MIYNTNNLSELEYLNGWGYEDFELSGIEITTDNPGKKRNIEILSLGQWLLIRRVISNSIKRIPKMDGLLFLF